MSILMQISFNARAQPRGLAKLSQPYFFLPLDPLPPLEPFFGLAGKDKT